MVSRFENGQGQPSSTLCVYIRRCFFWSFFVSLLPGPAETSGDGGAAVASAEAVEGALAALGEGREAVGLAHGGHAIPATGQHLVGIRLMPDVPDDAILDAVAQAGKSLKGKNVLTDCQSTLKSGSRALGSRFETRRCFQQAEERARGRGSTTSRPRVGPRLGLIEDIVERHGELDDAQAGSQVTASLRDVVDEVRTQLLGNLRGSIGVKG